MDISSVSPEEYGIWLINTINVSVNNLDISCELAVAEVDRSLKLLGIVKGMSKISKMTYLKKVRKCLVDIK